MTTATISAPVSVSAPAPIRANGREQSLPIVAILPDVARRNGKNLDDTKERVQAYKVYGLAVEDGHPVSKCLLELRIYMGRSKSASTVYASLWVHGDRWTAGSGSASGYGYCKYSAAAQGAIDSAGVKLYGTAYNSQGEVNFDRPCDIGGVGETAIKTALLAIGQALGYSDLSCES